MIDNTTPGLLAVRYLKAQAIGGTDALAAAAFAQANDAWPAEHKRQIIERVKSGVSGISSVDIGGGSYIAADFQNALRPLTIIGRLPLRRVPPHTRLLTQTARSVATWTGNGAGRLPVVGTYTSTTLPIFSLGALSVSTNELLADNSFEAETEVLAELLGSCSQMLNHSFIDSDFVGVANVSPPSITYAAPKIAASGMTAESLDLDLAEAIAALLATGSDLRNAYWVMGANLAAAMCLFRGSGGSPCYPTMSGPNPTLAGLPVITSGVFETDTGGGTSIVLLDASQITYCEAPAILRTSTHAMIEMSDAPSVNSSTPVAATTMASMFQTECTALIATLSCNYVARRAGVVQVITGAYLEGAAS